MSEKSRGAYRGFVERAEEILAEINQIFLDADHWNRSVRKPHEAVIDPDPDGALKSAKRNLEAFIARANTRRDRNGEASVKLWQEHIRSLTPVPEVKANDNNQPK